MKREDDDNVRGNRNGRGGAGDGRDDRERLERCLLRVCVLQVTWKSSLERSRQVRDHLHTQRTDGNGFGLGFTALTGAVVSIPPN